MTLEAINAAGAELEQLYYLKTAPLAIRLIDRDEIPEGCTQPSKDGIHYALCQALAFSRRTRNALAVFAEDHWCLWPVINFRLRALDEADKKYVGSTYFIRDPEVSYRHFCATAMMSRSIEAAITHPWLWSVWLPDSSLLPATE